MLPPSLSAVAERTSAAFGWQWQEFVELYDQYEAQFLDWIHPVEPEFFRDKVVLDAGCGNGRHAFYAATYGSREVVAMDLSEAVETDTHHAVSRPSALRDGCEARPRLGLTQEDGGHGFAWLSDDFYTVDVDRENDIRFMQLVEHQIACDGSH